MGLTSFSHMISVLNNQPKILISRQEYDVFDKEYIFEQLKGKRFGRAFCERFGITDPVVNCLVDEDIAREMINENYIQ